MKMLSIYSSLDSFNKYLSTTYSVSDTGNFYQLCFVLLKTIVLHEFPLNVEGQMK